MNSNVKYGQEHGRNLIKICKNLLKNDDLCRLLKNTDYDPLNKEKHPEKIDNLKDLSGVLHMENFTEDTKNISFQKE